MTPLPGKVKVTESGIKWHKSSMPISTAGMKEFGDTVSVLCPKKIIIIIIIINLIYIAQFDTNGILKALYIVITYIQMQYVHVCTYAEQSYKYTYTCLHIHTYTVTCTNIYLPTY